MKLGEEEWLRTEQKDEEIASEGNQIDGTNSETESIDTEPKLTRAKAKALNKQPLPLRSLHSTLEESEAALLVREEFHSDDEDDEYVPTNEDLNVRILFFWFFCLLYNFIYYFILVRRRSKYDYIRY